MITHITPQTSGYYAAPRSSAQAGETETLAESVPHKAAGFTGPISQPHPQRDADDITSPTEE